MPSIDSGGRSSKRPTTPSMFPEVRCSKCSGVMRVDSLEVMMSGLVDAIEYTCDTCGVNETRMVDRKAG
jgi:hypothetical protein